MVDGEVVCCDERSLAAFHVLRHRRNEPAAFFYAFDLSELDGTDLRREPTETRRTGSRSSSRQAAGMRRTAGGLATEKQKVKPGCPGFWN